MIWLAFAMAGIGIALSTKAASDHVTAMAGERWFLDLVLGRTVPLERRGEFETTIETSYAGLAKVFGVLWNPTSGNELTVEVAFEKQAMIPIGIWKGSGDDRVMVTSARKAS